MVNGWDWASLNRAQPLDTNVTAHNAASAYRIDRRIRMTDRLRTLSAAPPPAATVRRRGGCARRPTALVWMTAVLG
ncbi:hypothetical protein I551_3072 [Mycobacterium ulcerans str. Harvey]|uniref:Uncharacterized protein n=1 Tax=Mycobacterium ulcerans str. Harvey TaxID=1299332 RepID=A0ABP3AI61_MYCUL|nr:hypothetical protein I551_3072 [Mycobacterium ulcerans str. Harvey]